MMASKKISSKVIDIDNLTALLCLLCSGRVVLLIPDILKPNILEIHILIHTMFNLFIGEAHMTLFHNPFSENPLNHG